MTVKNNIWMKIQFPMTESIVSCRGDHLEPALISRTGLIFLILVENIQTLSSPQALVPFSVATCQVPLAKGLKTLSS